MIEKILDYLQANYCTVYSSDFTVQDVFYVHWAHKLNCEISDELFAFSIQLKNLSWELYFYLKSREKNVSNRFTADKNS